MGKLHDIGVKFSTDKSGHGYMDLYELLFAKFGQAISLLEVGAQFGCSLRAWKEYFRFGDITGIDSVDNGIKKEDRISVLIGHAYSQTMIDRLGGPYEVIIDDGSHTHQDQVWFVKYYLKLLSHNGLLIVEDVANSGTIPYLSQALPNGFQSVAVDLTIGHAPDSRLFIAWMA